ncbi:MAG: acyl-CoA dehydrogenase family protein [Myxococcales bacterium]|nr:acyl-CoA dehydrogenase family protein [Myxococcales bacterium]
MADPAIGAPEPARASDAAPRPKAEPPQMPLGPVLAAIDHALAHEADALENDRRGALPAALLERARELGLFGATIGDEHGGLGLGLGATCRVIAQVARHDRALATCVGLHNGLGVAPLRALGTEEQKARWLPLLASGEVIAAFAATEAGAGSDLSAIATHYHRARGGVCVNGEKQYVTNGRLAGLFTVLARAKETRGQHALICIPASAPGLEVGPEEHKLGIRASSTTSLHLDEVPVSGDALLGEGGRGLKDAYDALAIGRTVMSAGCVGTAQAAFDATLAHVQRRRQFRRPIGAFGASRAHVAAMAARVFAMESIVAAVGALDATIESIASLSTVAKVFCSEGAFEVTDRALQLHGAMGFLEDTGVALLARDCRVTRIFEGANDVLLTLLGSELLARSGDAEDEDVERANAALAALRRAGAGSAGAALVERWLGLSRSLRAARADLRATLGVRAVERQDCLHAIARAHVALEVASCALARSGDAPDVATHAGHLLMDEARRALAALDAADARFERARAVSEDLYERGTRWAWST